MSKNTVKMKTIEYEAQKLIDISNELSTGEIIAFNAIDNKNIIFAIAKKELDYREHRSSGIFAIIKPDIPQDYSVYISCDNQIINLTNIENEPYNIHDVQILSKDSILLVCCRSRRRSENDYDLNGRIYSTDGTFQNEILLGDGIQNVQVTANGVIWTSYFDEGIIGNYGWNSPVGACGLIAWNSKGEKACKNLPDLDLGSICDCYALNVESNSTTWCYYYTNFPLVKIKDHEIQNYWNISVHGSHAFAIYRNYALFRGGYDDSDTLYLIELLDKHKTKVHLKVTLTNLSQIDWVTARGDTLFLLSSSSVYTVSVHEILLHHSS